MDNLEAFPGIVECELPSKPIMFEVRVMEEARMEYPALKRIVLRDKDEIHPLE